MDTDFQLAPGRIVMVQIARDEFRPAICAKAASPTKGDLHLFLLPGDTDRDLTDANVESTRAGYGVLGASRGEQVGQWVTPQELALIAGTPEREVAGRR